VNNRPINRFSPALTACIRLLYHYFPGSVKLFGEFSGQTRSIGGCRVTVNKQEKKAYRTEAQGIEAEIPQARLWRAEELERIARSPPQAGMRPNTEDKNQGIVQP
jgi:hypothetical protein